jgi:hypothetical protein
VARRPSILDDYVTPKELARELGINPITLVRWHMARIGPPRTKMGRRVLYRRVSVQEWLVAQEQEQLTPAAWRRKPARASADQG